ncbi:MAG: SpoIIE family protein phosphatase [bacterium]|nr:SpoIIE family protein phosphatase [bacterium]
MLRKRALNTRSRVKSVSLCLLLVFIPAIIESAPQPDPVHIESVKEKVSLAGKWHINTGDNPEYSTPGFDDSGWDLIKMPGSITKYTLDKTDRIEGILWLRKKVFIGKELSRAPLGLILGTIANADETFFNGEKIGGMGGFPPEEKSMWNHPRNYFIPEDIINYGAVNVIAVRIHFYAYGEMRGTPAITNEKDWSSYKTTSTFLLVTSNYLIMAMGIAILLFFLILYIRRPKSHEYLFYILQILGGFLVTLELCNYWDTFGGSTLTRFKVLGFAWGVLNVAHPIFLHRFYRFTRKRTEIALWTYLCVITFIAVVFTNTSIIRLHASLFAAGSTAIGCYNVSCYFSALYKKRPFAKIISFFGIIVVLGAIHDGISYFSRFSGVEFNIFGYTFQYMILVYSAAFLFLGTALVLVNMFVRTMQTVDRLNTKLEKKVLKRTNELSLARDEMKEAFKTLEAKNQHLVETNQQLENSERIHKMDMEMAKNVQESIFPGAAPESGRYDIAFAFEPISSVSGDFYDFYRDDNSIKGLSLFDVSGHGISSGLITVMARSTIYRNFKENTYTDLNAIMDRINTELTNEISEVGFYITGILLRFKEDWVEYANSGHPDLLCRSGEDGKVTKILDKQGKRMAGPLLGVKGMNIPFKSLDFEFEQNDVLLLYSDCLIESINPNNDEFDETHLMELFKEAPDGTAREMLDYILERFYRFVETKDQLNDDLTIILVKKME